MSMFEKDMEPDVSCQKVQIVSFFFFVSPQIRVIIKRVTAHFKVICRARGEQMKRNAEIGLFAQYVCTCHSKSCI